jgi:putative intracellular protease/amidase
MGKLSRKEMVEIARATGIDVIEQNGAIIWDGPFGGQAKAQGPLAGKKIACIAGSEFSDYQAYYLASYIGEFGGDLEFLLVDWVTYKFTRPNIKTKGVVGMWGVSLDPIPVMGPAKHASKNLKEANPGDYDAAVIIGGHSADVIVTEIEVENFLKTVAGNGGVIGGIGAGLLPLIRAGLVNGKKVTGNQLADFMLKKISSFQETPVAIDGKLVTARDTLDTPEFLRALCRAFDPGFNDPRKGCLEGKKGLIIAGEDFEDIELAVPLMEWIYRGAQITLATFEPVVRARPPLIGIKVVQGNFGMSVPLQEIPQSQYGLKDLSQVSMAEFDWLFIPGAFCPWNLVEAQHPLEFLKKADQAGKLLSYLCHGPIPVAAAGLIEGRKVTGWQAAKDAVEIMGGEYNQEWAAVVDGNHVSGRTPPEIPEFVDAVTAALLS